MLPTAIDNHNPTPSTVLIIDDDPNLRILLASALQENGYQTITAQDGMDGLEQAQTHQPDIILLDAVMPELDGLACCRQLHQTYSDAGQSCPPILMLTAMADSGTMATAFEAGASDFITKPIQFPILQQRMRRCLENQALRQRVQLAESQLSQLQKQLATAGSC